MSRRTSKIWTSSREEVLEIYNNSKSVSDALLKFGLPNGGNRVTLKQRLNFEKLDYNILTERGKHIGLNKLKIYTRNKQQPLSDILIEHSTYHRGHLKKRLIKEGLLENRCALCKTLPEWECRPLMLILDHKNGVNDDCRLDNLRLVCPNCNSQLDTFAGRNKERNPKKYRSCNSCGNKITSSSKSGLCRTCADRKNRKAIRPDKETLKNLVNMLGYVVTGKKYNVTGSAIRKWVMAD
jgi:Zn finger protein HypA/HybF involved in hydrogenase expression